MVGKIQLAIIGFLSVSGVFGAPKARLRRDETPSMPYDPDTTSHCTWWWDNDGSIACSDIPSTWGITLEDFRRWNPSITETCGNFLTDHSYCVEAFGEPEPTIAPPTTTSSAGAPGPTQPGQIETCNRWDLVESGNTCDTFTKKYPGLTRQLLVEWNSEIGAQCQYLWVDYYICTGVKGWTPTGTITGTNPTPTNNIPTPSPVQPGIVDNCNKFHLVKSGDDCGTIASQYGISREKFLAWNSGVGAGCGSLWLDYYVCVSIIGETPTITTTTKPGPTNGVATPTPIRPGMTDSCEKFHMVVEGDECRTLASKNGITLDQLVSWNPEVKTDCSGLWLGYYICIKAIGVTPNPTTTTGPTKPTNGIATPTPILPGMVENCDKFHLVADGDQCGNIAQKYGISQSQFSKWNPQVGAGCSGLWLGYYVCVKTVGSTPTTTTTTTAGNGISTPTPTRPGMVTNCDAFHKVKSGDNCDKIASSYGITTSQLYTWNTEVGTNCGGLWVDYYICVSIVGVNPKPTTTTTKPGNGIATPTPVQTGMTGNCNRFYKVVSGDSCEGIAKKASITLANFYAWNKGVGSSCQTLWLGYYVCTGVK